MKEFFRDKVYEKSSLDTVIELLEKKGYEYKSENNDNKYDLLFIKDGKEKRVEIKQDFTSKRTGNIGVEVETRGKASGIKTSKSDMYVYKYYETINNVIYTTVLSLNKKKLLSSITMIEEEMTEMIERRAMYLDMNMNVEFEDYQDRVIKKSHKRNFNYVELENSVKINFRYITDAGDLGSNSKNFLFPIKDFKNTFALEVLEHRKSSKEELQMIKENEKISRERNNKKYRN